MNGSSVPKMIDRANLQLQLVASKELESTDGPAEDGLDDGSLNVPPPVENLYPTRREKHSDVYLVGELCRITCGQSGDQC